jgi:DNA-binding MurR/RpiR family transcriptional regulator
LAAGVRLTPTQRRVLTHLLERAGQLAWLSAGELAEQAGVSQPSVTRLANALGFDGWVALQRRLRDHLAGPADAGANRVGPAEVVAAESTTLAALAAALPAPDEMHRLGRALRESEPLVVVGLRAAAYLASYTAYLAAKVHPGVVAITNGGHDAVDALVSARAAGASAALVVCMPRYPTETVDLLGEAGALGYRVALVADEAMPAPPGPAPAWRIGVPVGSSLTFDAHPAALVALGLVLDALCDADPGVTERRLEALDGVAARQGTYWGGPGSAGPAPRRSGRRPLDP